MLHKDPDHKSFKTGQYAKMLLDRFIKEQPRNSYEKVFGSSSTVIAAAQIAHYHGAEVENIEKLLQNPGSTQQRLTRIGGPHGGGGLGQPEPILYGQEYNNNNDDADENDDDDGNNNNRKTSPYNRSPSNQVQVETVSGTRSKKVKRMAALPSFSRSRSPRPTAATAEAANKIKSLLASHNTNNATRDTAAAGKKHITIVQVQTPQEREASQLKRVPGSSGRPFFSKENREKVGHVGTRPDEEILSTLVSSALHLNPVVDESNLNSPPQSPSSADSPSLNNNNNNKVRAENSGDLEENDEENGNGSFGKLRRASFEGSTTSNKRRDDENNNNKKRGITAADRIDPQVQSYFRELGNMFSFNTNYTSSLASATKILNSNNNNPRSRHDNDNNNASLLSVPPPASPLKLHLLPSALEQQQMHNTTSNFFDQQRSTKSEENNNNINIAMTSNNDDDDGEQSPGTLFASMVPQRGSRRNSFSNFVNNVHGQDENNNEQQQQQDEPFSPLAPDAIATTNPSPQKGASTIINQQQSPQAQQPHQSPVSPLNSFLQHQQQQQSGNNNNNDDNNKKNIQLPVELCIQAIETVFPQMKISTGIQQALVCDEMVEDFYYNSDAGNADDSEPDVSRGTLTMREAEDLLFTANDSALDLFLFLGAYNPQASAQPLAMPENIDGMETNIKLRQRLAILNKRFDPLHRQVRDFLSQQVLSDADVEMQALGEFQKQKAKKLAKTGGKAPSGAHRAHQQQMSENSNHHNNHTNNDADGGEHNQHDGSNLNLDDISLTRTADEEGPLPFSMKVANAVNCFDVQQLVLPITRLCEFEIIPWSIMDIYVSVLFSSWADLGFVSMYSKSPPLIDFEEFASLLAVHRLVLHRREEQVKSVRRIPVGAQPFTPWMPIVQRRVMRQTVMVAQMAKKGRMLSRANSVVSSSGMHQLGASTGIGGHHGLGESGALNTSSIAGGRASSVHSSAANTEHNHHHHHNHHHNRGHHHNNHINSSSSQIQRVESVYSTGANSSSGVSQKQTNTRNSASTPPQSGAQSVNETPSAQSTYLNLPLDDGTEAGGAGGVGGGGDAYDDLLDEEDENRIAMEKSEQMLDQIHDTQFKSRPVFEPPQHLVGVAPKWSDDKPHSWVAKWQAKMSRVKSRYTHTEPTDAEKPLSYQKLPLYDEWDDPIYQGPSEITQEYAQRLEAAGPQPFAVRKIDRSSGSNVPRFDKNLRPTSSKQWSKRDQVDGGTVVDRGGLRPVKPLTTLRSGMYWFCSSKEDEKKMQDEIELERLRKADPLEFERKMRETKKKFLSKEFKDQDEEEEEEYDDISSTDEDELDAQERRRIRKAEKRKADEENGIFRDDDDDNSDDDSSSAEEGDGEEIPEIASNNSSTDSRFDALRSKQEQKKKRQQTKMSRAERRRLKARRDEEREKRREEQEFLDTRPRTAPRKPFVGMTKSHTTCNPPPPSVTSLCPDTRPTSAQYQKREVDFRRGYNSKVDDTDRRSPSPMMRARENNNEEHNNINSNMNQFFECDDDQDNNNNKKNASSPNSANKKPLVIRHWSEITSATLNSAEGNIVYQPDIAIAGKNKRPTTATNSSFEARKVLSISGTSLAPTRPTTANSNSSPATRHPTRPTTASSTGRRNHQIANAYSNNQSTFSRPHSAIKNQQQSSSSSFTGFHKYIHASENIVEGTNESRVAEFLSNASSSRGGVGFPIQLRHPESGGRRNQYAPPSSSASAQVSYQVTPQQTSLEMTSNILGGSQQNRQRQGSPSKSLKDQYKDEVKIPNLTQDQCSSFHRLLREAKKEAETRVAQQRQSDYENKEREKERERQRLRNASPESESSAIGSMHPSNANNGLLGSSLSEEASITKKEQSQQEAEEFHNEVMSWYKQGFGTLRNNSPTAGGRRRSRSPHQQHGRR